MTRNAFPSPPYGAFKRAAARNELLTQKGLSRFWNRHRVPTLAVAIAILRDPELGGLGLTLEDLIGVAIPADLPLARGVWSREVAA